MVEGADFIEVTPPAQWRAAAIHTYDDHRMAMCLSLAAFNPLAARTPPAPGCPIRILDPKCVGKTFPDYFEALVRRGGTADVASGARDHHRRAHGLGQGHAGRRGGRRAGLPPAGLRRAVPCHRAGIGVGLRARWTTWNPAWHGWPGSSSTCASATARRAAGRGCAGEEVSGGTARWNRTGLLASRVSAMPCRAQLRCTALQLAFRRPPGLVADGRDMGTVVFPGRGAEGVPHGQRRRARRAAP